MARRRDSGVGATIPRKCARARFGRAGVQEAAASDTPHALRDANLRTHLWNAEDAPRTHASLAVDGHTRHVLEQVGLAVAGAHVTELAEAVQLEAVGAAALGACVEVVANCCGGRGNRTEDGFNWAAGVALRGGRRGRIRSTLASAPPEARRSSGRQLHPGTCVQRRPCSPRVNRSSDCSSWQGHGF